MGEDELVAAYLSQAEAIIRGISRDTDEDSRWCGAYDNEERCPAAITCGECRVRIFIGQGTGEVK